MKPVKMRKARGFVKKSKGKKTNDKEQKKRNLIRWSMEKRLS
tara:strand:+ start:1877 stop:2002 length:126 start_codon:yes stop_codon:yes gene_type:complete